MPFFKRLPTGSTLYDVFLAQPGPTEPLLAYHEALLRAKGSPFTVAERELIAAFTSGLNACSYCHGIHAATAEAFGVDPGLLDDLLRDLEAADVDDRLRPVLRYVQKLTLTPSRMTQADADALFAVGWDDRALFDAVSICALFNAMNRLVEGFGIEAPAGYTETSAQRLRELGYAGLWRQIATRLESADD